MGEKGLDLYLASLCQQEDERIDSTLMVLEPQVGDCKACQCTFIALILGLVLRTSEEQLESVQSHLST